jgi:hypothetical protein
MFEGLADENEGKNPTDYVDALETEQRYAVLTKRGSHPGPGPAHGQATPETGKERVAPL